MNEGPGGGGSDIGICFNMLSNAFHVATKPLWMRLQPAEEGTEEDTEHREKQNVEGERSTVQLLHKICLLSHPSY